MVTIQHAVDVLNDLHRRDPSVLTLLINHRIVCNDEFADYPTVIVGDYHVPGKLTVGLIGILNAIFGPQDGTLAAVVEQDGTLHKFQVLKK